MIQTIDFRILDWIQANLRSDALDWFMPRVTVLGNGGILWILLALCLLAARRTRRWGIVMLVGLLFSLVAGNLVVKPLAARSRPCWLNPEIRLLIASPKDYSFPSGHTLTGVISSVVLLHYHRVVGISALVLALCVAFSRLYLYVHFPTDVLGGLLLGIVLGLCAVALCERVIFPRVGVRKTKA